MTDLVLLLWRKLGRCLPKCGYKKNRIIPEAISSTRNIGDHALNLPIHAAMIARWLSHRNHAAKAGGTLLLRESLQLLKNDTKPLCIRSIDARKPGRVHTGSASQCIYFQTRVISERE